MAAADLTMKVHVERHGLLLKLYTVQGKFMSMLNLQEGLGLSDEQAKELLAKLDERDKQETKEA